MPISFNTASPVMVSFVSMDVGGKRNKKKVNLWNNLLWRTILNDDEDVVSTPMEKNAATK